MKNELLSNTLLLFLAAAVTFIFVPLFMIGSSPEDYVFLDANIFFKSALLFSIIFGLILSFISLSLHLFKLNKIANFFSYFVFSWVILAGLILSLSVSTGMVEPEKNPVDYSNLIVVFVLSLILSAIALTKFKKIIQIFLLIVLITSVVPSFISVYHLDTFKINTGNNPSQILSNKKNIFVIGFDGLPGEIVSDVIKSNQAYSNELKDFIVFENAVAQAPATWASLTGDIYGVQDYKSKGSDIRSVKKALLSEELAKEVTAKHIHDSFQYGYRGFNIKNMKFDSITNVIFQQMLDTFDFFKYPIIRMGTRQVLNRLDWENNVAPLKKYIMNIKVPEIIEKLKKHNGPNWDKKPILSLDVFDSFTSNISVSNKDFSLRYLHFHFTHYPVDYDAECKYRSDDKAWYDANQNEKGVKNQNICAVGKFIDFIHKLKELGIYDKSLIVFKSDHGKPSSYFSKSPNSLRINGHSLWGYNRYRPTLMIKDFNGSSDSPKFKSELVLLNDIAKTLCEKSGVDADCEKFHGVNLLGKSLETDEAYYIYTVKNSKGSHRFATHQSVRIPSRKSSLLQAMKDSKLIVLSEAKE